MSIASELRHGDLSKMKWDYKEKPKTNLYIILDNVLDTQNIGMIFRIADSLGANQVILTGSSELPTNKKIKSSSVKMSEVVNWSYMRTAVEAVRFIRPYTDEIIGLELTEDSRPYNDRKYFGPTAIVLGNEERGIKPETLAECDSFVKLPMNGVNYSMNVAVSLGIFGYHLLNNRKNT